jgi:hypothetical protein
MFGKIFENLDKSDNELLEQLVINEAKSLGLFEDDQLIEEAKARNVKTTIQKVTKTKQQKLARLAKRAALMIAADKKDADYLKYEKFIKLAGSLRSKIEKKYSNAAKAQVKAYLKGNSLVPRTSNPPSKQNKMT